MKLTLAHIIKFTTNYVKMILDRMHFDGQISFNGRQKFSTVKIGEEELDDFKLRSGIATPYISIVLKIISFHRN